MRYEDSQRGYANLWNAMAVRPEKHAALAMVARKLEENRERYEHIAISIGCPWWFVAIAHQMESGASFSKHLHNGDPLTARTVNVPPGRPTAGSPPFTFEASAIDALRLKDLHLIKDWSVSRCLYELERFNGFGYVKHKINSPYLWSFTTLYTKGKYIRDHVYDADAVSAQPGAAAILRVMMDLGIVEKDDMNELENFVAQFGRLAPTVVAILAGPAPALAVKVLAEALGEPAAKADKILKDLDESPITRVIDIITRAEATASVLSHIAPVTAAEQTAPPSVVPVSPPAVIVPVPVPQGETTTTVISNPEAGNVNVLDKLFPSLTGWKTYIGIAIYVGGAIAQIFAPQVVTPDVMLAISYVAGGLAGAGIISKIDRYITIFKPQMKTTIVSQK